MVSGYISQAFLLTASASVVWILYRKVQFYFFPTKPALSRYKHSPQAYAIVTGASAGIGYGYAQELIANGFGVILIASRKERLDSAAEALRKQNPFVAVKTIVYNALDTDSKNLASALEPVMHLPITVLVNNVGAVPAQPAFKAFTEFSAKEVMDTISINVTFMVQLTRIMILVLERNGPSVVINMGSLAEAGAPWAVLYGGCKAFVSSFSAGLARESRTLGWKIDSLGLVVGDVWSEFNNEGLGPGTATARQFAKTALDRVEMIVDRQLWISSPHWLHALGASLVGNLPETMTLKMLADTIGRQREIRVKRQ